MIYLYNIYTQLTYTYIYTYAYIYKGQGLTSEQELFVVAFFLIDATLAASTGTSTTGLFHMFGMCVF